MNKFLILTLFISLLFSCAPTRFIKPLNKNQQAVNLSLGGPLIGYGTATIPIPFITGTYGYGIDSSLTGFGSINITSALFGNIQCELGATKQLLKQKKYFPALNITPVANLIYRPNSAFKFYPQLDVNLFWEYGKRKNIIYVGIDNWFELSGKRTFEEKQKNHWFITPMLGHSFVGKKWDLNIEAKIIAPNLSNEKIVVDYKTPFKNHGAFGVYLSYTRKI
jgi:hypothetical protein